MEINETHERQVRVLDPHIIYIVIYPNLSKLN